MQKLNIHNKAIVALMAGALIIPLAGCETTSGGGYSKQQTGTVVGGVLGGVLGSTVGGGKGKVAATIAGALIGGLIGGSVGSSLDRADEMKAQQVLERNRVNQASTWRNPDTGNDVTVTPTRTYNRPSGQTCREYTTSVVIQGKRETAHGNACRQSDGSWQIVN
ncbi:MAG: RT0821/Lpp0805 family surface protein [Gammaproteobacteria bacterium]